LYHVGSLDNEEPDGPKDEECYGFLNLTDGTRCKEPCDKILYITGANEKNEHYFCKTNHLLRYLGKYYLGQGKSTPKKKTKSGHETRDAAASLAHLRDEDGN